MLSIFYNLMEIAPRRSGILPLIPKTFQEHQKLNSSCDHLFKVSLPNSPTLFHNTPIPSRARTRFYLFVLLRTIKSAKVTSPPFRFCYLSSRNLGITILGL